MDPGAFSGGLVTGVREGVEAALIVSIILTYLSRTGNARQAGRIWAGVLIAIAASATVGFLLYQTVGGLPAPYEQAFEGITLLAAAAVVTWMLFWMRRQAAAVRSELHAALDRALSEGGTWGMVLLAFTAVLREGLETAVFLLGQVTAASQGDPAGPLSVLVGAIGGLLVAAFLGYGFYRGSRRINLASFFRWTGIALVFIAAGLLGRAVHELAEIGVVGIGAQTAFDISALLPHESGIGQFLAAIFGYTSTPEVSRLVVYLAYLGVVLILYLRPTTPAGPPRKSPATA